MFKITWIVLYKHTTQSSIKVNGKILHWYNPKSKINFQIDSRS